MSDLDVDLEHRLRSLGELSKPNRPALDRDAMHRGAMRVARRRNLAVTVPAVMVVLAVAAGALVLRDNSPVIVDANNRPPSSLSERDRELLDFVRATIDVRRELVQEVFDVAAYAAKNDGTPALAAQRTRTDDALAAFELSRQRVDPGRDAEDVRAALKQLDNRLQALATLRRSVDGVQNDALGLVHSYQSTLDDLLATERGLINSTNSAALLRGLLSHRNLAAVTHAEALLAASLTVSVELGFYASTLPVEAAIKKADPTGCNPDAALNPRECTTYASAVEAAARVERAESTFDAEGTGAGKQIKRRADAGLRYSGLRKAAFEDGQGRNDLRGRTPGSTAIDPAEFRAAAEERIDTLIDAERQLLDLIQ